jgi:hypothetical protein
MQATCGIAIHGSMGLTKSSPGNAAINLEIRVRGNNNGSIGLSARQAARSIEVSKATSARAMIRLSAASSSP